MNRRTPLLAVVLAPLAIWVLVFLWKAALLPLYVSLWHGDTVLKMRLAHEDPATREQALRDAMSSDLQDAQLALEIVQVLHSDAASDLRSSAGQTLGQIGRREPLPTAVNRILHELVMAGPDDVTLAAAINAVSQAAAHNACPEAVVVRIAGIFNEQHLPWMYARVAEALGRIGASQSLPAGVFATLNNEFATTQVAGLREDIARAFAEIANGGALPATTLELLAAALQEDRNERIRVQAVYALARGGVEYPPAGALLMAARADTHRDVRTAADSGLRILEAGRLYANRTPVAVAQDRSLPVGDRLKAIDRLKENSDDPVRREQILALAGDDDPRMAAAALGLFTYIDGGPADAFDRTRLIPRLKAAMARSDAQVRQAAYGSLSSLFVHNRDYRARAADFRPQLEAGARDPDPGVRVVALAAVLKADPDRRQRAAILEQALTDSDPAVRRLAVGWLGSPETDSTQREALFARLEQDADTSVRAEAVRTRQAWENRERAWPVKLWQWYRAGAYTQLGLSVLTAATIAAPLGIGGVYLLYYMARLLTYLYQRRWRALAVIPVMAAWAGASYGMFLLYFMAGHAGNLDTKGMLQLAGALWGACALYAVLGWGLHYPVRR